ncbi:MAG: aminotransferase class V-fold PLP-dependent enzyme [Oscillospiraceae bacterium]|nr:aminotransferase class V-fold PLP-dependent enzyme [Oscillospiraceae bacterium]
MIYLDNGATSFHKPAAVRQAVLQAMEQCANPGRGGYPAAMAAAETVYRCRETAAEMFGCEPEQVVFTSNCTHGLNIAIQDLVKPGDKVVISGFEHNAVTRPLHMLGTRVKVAGRKLFDWENTLEEFEKALREGADAAVFTHVSNVFGYILPVDEMAQLCHQHGVPFILDAAQSAGCIPVDLRKLGAEYIAMPGHKGLLGPQGTGLLLCGRVPKPLMAGGTGSDSVNQNMPDYLPDRLEAGTVNVPGIAGLSAGLRSLKSIGVNTVFQREHRALERTVADLKEAGFQVFSGDHQASTVSFVPDVDCEEFASKLAKQGIAVRSGLHCAPLAHESAGTLDCGTVRVSYGMDASYSQAAALRRALSRCVR